jgi:UrcA family protein
MKTKMGQIVAIQVVGLLIVGGTVETCTAQEARSVTVRYGDLNLASSAGQKALQARVAGAARDVCGFQDRGIEAYLAWTTCYKGAIEDAMEQVRKQHPTVTLTTRK